MKRLWVVTLICIAFITVTSCNKQNTNNAKDISSLVTTAQEGQITDIILYFSPINGKYLIPEQRKAVVSGSLEQTLMLELLRGPKNTVSKSLPEGTSLISIKKSKDVVKVNLSGELKKDNGKVSDFDIYSIVNTLTEIPGINKVIIDVNGRNIKPGIASREFKRDRQLFNRDKSLNPREALLKQMNYEQQGKWLNSYLLMSDRDNDKYRKYFSDYINELEEMKENNFLNAKFTVGSYIVNGDKAKVKVNFYSQGSNGESIPGQDVFFNCVNIDGVWMVDWLTAQ